jgi:hypothetical protein
MLFLRKIPHTDKKVMIDQGFGDDVEEEAEEVDAEVSAFASLGEVLLGEESLEDVVSLDFVSEPPSFIRGAPEGER